MDNLICSILGVGVFTAFVVGLAGSISAIPFIVIVGIVLLMVFYDMREQVKIGFAEEKARRERE